MPCGQKTKSIKKRYCDIFNKDLEKCHIKKKKVKIPSVDQDVGQLELSHPAGEDEKCYNHSGKLAISYEVNIYLLCNTLIILMGNYPSRHMFTQRPVHTNVHSCFIHKAQSGRH